MSSSLRSDCWDDILAYECSVFANLLKVLLYSKLFILLLHNNIRIITIFAMESEAAKHNRI